MIATTMTLLLASVLSAAGTRLQSDGKILFSSGARVTFGATYSERAVKASITSPKETDVTIRTGREPRRIFVNGDELGRKKWTYDAGTQCLHLHIGAGNSDIQVRFDNVTSVKPFTREIPIMQCGSDWKPLRRVGQMKIHCAAEKIRGGALWEGADGVYRIRPILKNGANGHDITVSVTGGALLGKSADSTRYYLANGSAINASGPAPGFVNPLAQVAVQLESATTATVRVPKGKLDWNHSIVVEGEAFSAEGGGQVKRSTDHKHTHDGSCIYDWGTPGNWLAWKVPVKTAGNYLLTIIGATAEKTALRSVELDGSPLPGAGVISMAGTGGWGRTNADEWQPFRPVDAHGKPVVLRLSAGLHILKMTNLIGQHFNVDCILFTPQK